MKKISLRDKIIEAYPDDAICFFDGFDDAILGIEDESMRVIYSTKKALKIIYAEMKITKRVLDADELESGMTIKEKRMEMAREHFDYNVKGTKGQNFPIWCDDDFDFFL